MTDATQSKRLLYVLDDGWRYEKQELVYFLKERDVKIDIVTHDQQTYDGLKGDFNVRLLPIHSLKKDWRYPFVMFFAKELDTKTVQLFNRLKYYESSLFIKCVSRLRAVAGKLGLRRYTYCEALERLFKGSQKYADILTQYDVLLFSPVSVIDKRIIYEAKNRGVEIVSWVF